MQFTNCRLAVVAFIVFLASCSQLKREEGGDGAALEVDGTTAQIEGEQIPEVPFVAIAKPAAVSVSVPASARQEFEVAKALMQTEDWEDASNRLLLMTETYPQLAGVYVNLGICYATLDKPVDAERAYRFAIEKNPLNFDAYTNLGVLLREQGKFQEAEQVYIDALAQWPHHQPSLINLGVLYDLYMGRLSEALTHFETAQQLNVEEDRQLKGWIVDLQRRIAQ